MTQDAYEKALQVACSELNETLRVRSAIEKRIAQLTATVKALTGLVTELPKVEDSSELGDLGISEAIRQLLRETNQGLTPAEIKVLLEQAQFNLSKYVNASAVIHSTLKRLEAQGEIMSQTVDPPGVTIYFFRHELSPEEVFGKPSDFNFAEQMAKFPTDGGVS